MIVEMNPKQLKIAEKLYCMGCDSDIMLPPEFTEKWYRRAGILIMLVESIEKAEALLDFIEGVDK